MSKAVAPKKINPNYQKAWRSMRILREWSIHSVVCTIEGATVVGISKFVASLERHGIVEKLPGYKKGRVGDHQRYRIYSKLADQPTPPQVCHLCGQLISAKICDPSLKETETQTDKETERQRKKEKRATQQAEALAAHPLTMAELEQIEAELYPQKEKQTQRQTETQTALSEYPDEGWHVVPEDLKRRLNGGIHDAT